MILMAAGGVVVMVTALFLLITPSTTSAAEPLRVMIIVHSTTTRHVVGTTRHHLLVEALASASTSLHQPFSYRFVGSSMVPSTMFGARNDATGTWTIRVNGKRITNLQDSTLQRGDQVTIERLPSS